jgi:MFS family permease
MFSQTQKTNPFFPLALISICLVGAMSTWFSGTVILLELTLRLELGASQQVWLTNSVQVGFVVGALLIAFFNIADTAPLPILIGLSCALASITNLLLIWIETPYGIIALRFCTGVALSGVYPPVVKLIATWFEKGRGIAMGIIIGALTIGCSMPHLFRALTLDTDWLLVIWSSSLITFISSIIFCLFISEGPFFFARARFDPRQIMLIIRNKPLTLVNIGYAGHMWELYAMWAWILVFAQFSQQNFVNFPFGTPEYFCFFVVAVGAIGCIAGGLLSDIFGRCYTTAILMIISGTCAFLIGFLVDGPPVIFAVIADSGQFSAAVTELADPHLVGTALTAQMALGFGITVITIWLVPIFAEWLGSFQWAFLFLVPGPIIGALAMLLLRKRQEAYKLALGKR